MIRCLVEEAGHDMEAYLEDEDEYEEKKQVGDGISRADKMAESREDVNHEKNLLFTATITGKVLVRIDKSIQGLDSDSEQDSSDEDGSDEGSSDEDD